MAPASTALLHEVERRLRGDAEFAGVLAAVVDAPTRSAGSYRHAAASALNERRRREALEGFQQRALRTADVQALLGLGTPQAVHRLRSRGRLVGEQQGN